MNGKDTTTELYTVRELMTPERAADILAETNAKLRNRNPSPRAVERYAEHMAHGQWEENGETIKISPEGYLVDGQHRLHAVIMSKATVPLLVAYNVPPSVFQTIDCGRRRTFADALSVRGFEYPRIRAAVTRLVLAYDSYVERYVTGNDSEAPRLKFRTIMDGLSVKDIVAFADANADALNEAVEAARQMGSALGYRDPLGALFFLLSRDDVTEAEYVRDALATGRLSENDDQWLLFRERLLRVDRSQHKLTPATVFAIALKTHNYWIHRIPMVPASMGLRPHEPFPHINRERAINVTAERVRRKRSRSAEAFADAI